MHWLDITGKLCALILSIFGIIKIIEEIQNRKNKKKNTKHAKLKMYASIKKYDPHDRRITAPKKYALKIVNDSEYATAYDVQLFCGDEVLRPYPNNPQEYIGSGEMKPRHAEVINNDALSRGYRERLYLKWRDETGIHTTQPITIDALETFDRV